MKYNYQYRPLTEAIRSRIELILSEEANRVEDPKRIDLFVLKATDRLIELILDEIHYHAERLR